MNFLQYLKRLVGNNWQASIGIAAFLVLLVTLSIRCSHAAELDLRAGSSVLGGKYGTGPVLGLQLYFPLGNELYLYGGTLLWGSTARVTNNWDWHAGMRACRWDVCANIGAAYLQRTDAMDGSHTNFNLEIAYRFSWWRLASVDLAHLSNAGTTASNHGRNAALVSVRLQ